MRLALHGSGTAILLLGALTACQPRGDIPVSTVPYPGQEPPGATAEVFAPGLVSTEANEILFGFFDDGALYFFSRRPGGFGMSDLYVSHRVDGGFADAENLGPVLNTEAHEWDPFVSPEQDFMIFCSTKDGGLGEDDLYVSFRNDAGGWSEPVNMGEPINSSGSENRPWITPDGRYFFFTSTRPGAGRRDVYWMDAAVIEDYRD